MARLFFQLLVTAWLILINARQWNHFKVIWNVPSEKCKELNEAKLLEKYGILVNDGHKFYGNNIVTLYEEKFGLYPYYHNYSDPTSAVNGGIPQLANISAHLARIRSNISKVIPNPKFDGLVIIDYEKWRPLWEQNNWYKLNIYQNESVANVKKRYTNISNSAAKLIAENEFNNASMKFLLATIREAKNLRPYALWGFYGLPFCNYSAGKNNSAGCGKTYEKFNNRLQPLYKEVNALYPSIYLPNGTRGITGCFYITSVLQEAKRCAKKWNPKMPIFAFTGIEYFPLNLSNPYYSQEDLHNSLKQAFCMNLQGAIIWSTTQNMTKRCKGIADYVTKYVGPEVTNLTKFAKHHQ